MLVFNKTDRDVPIYEMRKKVPADGKLHVINDCFAHIMPNYADKIVVLPEQVSAEIESMRNKMKITLERIELDKEYIEKYKKLAINMIESMNFFPKVNKWKPSVPKNKKIDLLYSCQVNDIGELRTLAIGRFKSSLESTYKQKCRICVCDTSINSLYDEIKDYVDKKNYIHCPAVPADTYNRSRSINIGVKKLVKTPYFIISDIDLVYPPTYVQELIKYTTCPVPIRVVFTNHNLGPDVVTGNYDECHKASEHSFDSTRSRGVAGGNGLLHLASFKKVYGYNEVYTGYGPEDQDLNTRLRLICNYVEIDDPKINSYHLYHRLAEHYDNEHQEKVRKFLEIKYNIEEYIINKGCFDAKKDIKILRLNDKHWGEHNEISNPG